MTKTQVITSALLLLAAAVLMWSLLGCQELMWHLEQHPNDKHPTTTEWSFQ